MAVKKCTCGKTRSPLDFCDGSHANANANITKPHLIQDLSLRKVASSGAGFETDDRGNQQFYPTAGVAVEGRKRDIRLPKLEVIQIPQLQSKPSLKYWVSNREGKCRNETEEYAVSQLKIMQQNGARIMFNLDKEGYYDRVFSNSNGNSVDLSEFCDLLNVGLKVGQVCFMTKLICGVGGRCGPRGDMCQVCKDYSKGFFEPKIADIGENENHKSALNEALIKYPFEFAEEIKLLIGKGVDYKLMAGRIVNQENSRSFNLNELFDMCNDMKKGARYVLEMLGVYRDREATTNTALKKQDLGGH